jgi:glycosyltransferase involved in cell wall biosynthesis
VIVSERIYPPLYPLGWIWNLLRRVAYRRACRVVMLTREGLNWLEKEIPGAKGAVIPNPAIYPLPLGEPVLRPVQILASERKLLLAVGRLDAQKGFDCLLDAFATLAIRHPSWDLVILGEGPERAGLEQQIAALGLQRRASLPGRAGNMGDWYGRADLYVMSSRFEGFPNTLTEAMAHGCAAVSYDCDTGPRDLIRHEVDGLLVAPVGDVPALTEALDRLMGDEGERTRMASRALEVRERYSMEKIIAMWDNVLEGKGW